MLLVIRLDGVQIKLLLGREANLLRHGLLLRGTRGPCRGVLAIE